MVGVAVVVVVLVALVASAASGGGHRGGGGRRLVAPARPPAPIPAVESGLLPWRLPAPISREVVLPGRGSRLVVLGGLSGATSAKGVFSISTANGALRSIGALRAGVHDGAGAIIAGRDVVFGGGTPTTVASLEAFPSGALGTLPSPRSDAAAVSVGATTYIVGGYTGSAPDAAVLATTDGARFKTVARLPVPVRYPAVATAGGKLYVFGGQAIAGKQAGLPVDDIQQVDPATHSARVLGHMSEPLQAAAAVMLGGQIYLAGGDTSTPQATTRGIGNVQVAAQRPSSPRLFTTSAIWAFDPVKRRLLTAGRLQVPVSHAGVAVQGSHAWLVGGESGGTQVAAVQMIIPNAAFGSAGTPGSGSPYFGGKLLIADRGNNRLLLLDTANQVVWRFPSSSSRSDPLGFFFPDDAFFVHHGTAIISNQEENETIQEIAYPSGKILWSYGHPHQAGSAPGYLHEPDDAYLLKNGQITVADAQNCRVLVIDANHRIAHDIGNGACAHDPPLSLGSPNGDTPLADGNLLVSEVNGSWVDELTPAGHAVWSVQLPISYPSDPQQLEADLYLIADYSTPGEILEFNRAGKILYRYDVTSGPGMLNHPSLVERLPSGVFVVNDDYRDRVAAIDPATKAIVWQYGVTDHKGAAPGLLNTPDGFDVLMANGSTPTHQATG
jgi:DNA-binding beta-propeller fold protein YncE